MSSIKRIFIILLFFTITILNATETKNKIIYLTSDIKIPFWQIMAKGIKNKTLSSGYEFEIYNAQNSAKKELELVVRAINEKVSGIIISPTNSSASVTILKLAKEANIPVVISDIGTDSGEYVSYISSANKTGAYNVGKVLANKMLKKGLQNGKVGVIAIPQKRLNGQERTAGFMEALDEVNIKGATIKQLKTWQEDETYEYVSNMIIDYPELKAVWLQTSNIYKGALKALNDSKKQDEILLVAFDAEPEFLDLIPNGAIIASGMQQPYLMGQKSASSMIDYLKGKEVEKNIQVPILTVSTEDINKKLPLIKLNVLGIENDF